jgi:hypothetical protein
VLTVISASYLSMWNWFDCAPAMPGETRRSRSGRKSAAIRDE